MEEKIWKELFEESKEKFFDEFVKEVEKQIENGETSPLEDLFNQDQN